MSTPVTAPRRLSIAEVRALDITGVRAAANAADTGAVRLGTAHDDVDRAARRLFRSWSGYAAHRARGSVRSALSHGDAAAAREHRVSTCLGDAYQRLRVARSEVLGEVQEAVVDGILVDEATSTVRAPIPEPELEQRAELAALRIADALDGFAAVDANAAAAVDAAMAREDAVRAAGWGDGSVGALAAMTHAAGSAPTVPSGTPAANNEYWRSLSPGEQAELIAVRPAAVGALDGIPADARHRANMHLLDTEQNRLEREADSARRAHADGQLTRVRAKLHDIDAVRTVMAANPSARLMTLDMRGDARGRAAVAVGDPDTSEHIAVTTPGLNTTVEGSLATMVKEAGALRAAAAAQIADGDTRTAGAAVDDVAAIAWIGYDAPQVGIDSVTEVVSGLADTVTPATARDGAARLAPFLDGLQAASQHPDPHITALGHSYGSTTTSLALQNPAVYGAVDDVVFYGSPGVMADDPGDLGLAPHHAYVLEADGDAVAEIGKLEGPLAPPLIRVLDKFGPDPGTLSSFEQLSTDEATTPGGRHLDGASGHGEYTRPGPDGGLRTSTYNMAAVVAGRTGNLIRK
ncbi:alpha/beta hydrolase [Tomitella gaofuii]|uniref:alpha/beta hydrolase n=1 Tax=Tomitella gaofuii TaxID=2760083 RepID=UPI0015F7DAB0|nr:alpha/beta hydrolase [Tomitella gaofuii]